MLRAPLAQVRLVLLLAVLGISSASILVRGLGGAAVPPLTVAAFRMLYAALLLLPFTWQSRGQVMAAVRQHPVALCAASLLLAAHFATFTLSLYRLEVARAVLLVSTQPVFVLLADSLARRSRPSSRTLAFLGLALAGVVTMLSATWSVGTSFAGDLLGFTAAATLAAYLILGRSIRRDVAVAHYNVPLYALAGASLGITAWFVEGAPAVGTVEVQLLLVLLAVLPTLCGHSLFHWTLRFLRPTVVSVAFLGEAVGAGVLAWLFFGEMPGVQTVVGGVVVLVGVVGIVTAEAEAEGV